MRIFISYAHVDWQFVDKLADRVRRYHDVWFDERLHAGQDWWQAILEQLNWCECFIYALSPESLASKYCRDEYNEAQNLGKHIIPIRLQPNIELPDTLQRIQYADFATRKFDEALADLIGDLGRLELQTRVPQTPAPVKKQKPKTALPVQKNLDEVETFRDAVEARKRKDHETALRLFNTLAQSAPDFLPEQVAGLIQHSQRELERQARQKEYDRVYKQVSLLTLDPYTLDDARKMWAELRESFPDIDHDPEDLAKQLINGIDEPIAELEKENGIPDWLGLPEEKPKLIRLMGSGNNLQAKEAVRILRRVGWGFGDDRTLQGANLQGAKLMGAKLMEANLQEVNLQGANLKRTKLSGAIMYGAELEEANLQGANLFKANLKEAMLMKANLQGAWLWETTLDGARLDRADLEGAEKATIAQLQSANTLAGCTLPDGTTLPGDSAWHRVFKTWCKRVETDRNGYITH